MQPLVRRILDILFVISMVSLLTVGLLWKEAPPFWMPVTLGVISLAAWLVLRRRRQVAVLVVFWLATYGALVLGTSIPIMVAVLLVFVGYGVRVGLRSTLIALVLIEIGFLVLHLVDVARPLLHTIYLMVSTIGSLAVPVVLGVVLSRMQTSISELASANAELSTANEDLAEQSLLAQDLLLSQERSRAARELHDSLGNRLTAVAMSIDYARNVADHDTERARDELAVARRDVGDALGDLRIWVRAMNPANRASEFGLSGLHDVAASFRGTGLSVEVDVPAQHPPLGQRLELFVVRFVQEGLTNALRHGRAEQVWVEVKLREGELLLQLRDDGAGAIGVPFEGFGLRALREQTAELGGRFEASNAPEGGFRIRAALPLPMLAQTAPGELSERVS